jgi:hypothetical protein
MLINPLNGQLNPICHLLALLRAHHILHVGRIRVNIPRNALVSSTELILNLLRHVSVFLYHLISAFVGI